MSLWILIANCIPLSLFTPEKLFKHKPQMAVVAYFYIFWKESCLSVGVNSMGTIDKSAGECNVSKTNSLDSNM